MVDNIIDQQSAHAKDLAERRRATTQRYREKNREQIRAQSRPYTKAYRLANLEAVKAKKRAKYAADGEYDRRYAREWYARNAEAAKAKHEAWLAANPGKRVEYETRRRARKAGAGGDTPSMMSWRSAKRRGGSAIGAANQYGSATTSTI
jgi:hypothetical protein